VSRIVAIPFLEQRFRMLPFLPLTLAEHFASLDGHCDYHVSVYGTAADHRVLFDGDCIFYSGKVCLQAIPDCRIAALAASAYRLHELDVDALCPGHFAIVLSGGSRHITQAVSYFDRLVAPPNII
jgi:glyoxylase-like metal-dependent hydrolase (beta-lactamase superfamily II)